MIILIEVLASLLLIFFGYIATSIYLKNGNLKKLDIKCAFVLSRNRIIYLVIAVLKSALLIILFNTLFSSFSFIHQLKLIVLSDCILPMAAVDFKVHKIPNQFILAALCLRVILLIVEFIRSYDAAIATLIDDAIGAAVIAGFFFIVSLAFKQSVGMGDIKLFAIMGLYQGIWGVLNSVFFSLAVSFFLSLGLLITRKKNRKDTISFGPSIFLGTLIAVSLTGI